jgi:hypothetical protein
MGFKSERTLPFVPQGSGIPQNISYFNAISRSITDCPKAAVRQMVAFVHPSRRTHPILDTNPTTQPTRVPTNDMDGTLKTDSAIVASGRARRDSHRDRGSMVRTRTRARLLISAG